MQTTNGRFEKEIRELPPLYFLIKKGFDIKEDITAENEVVA